MPNTDSSAPAATTDTSALDLSTFIPDAEQPQAPVDLQGFIPDPPQAAPAPGLEGFIADDPADQHLNESTRNQLVQRAAQDYVSGKTTDADLAKYKIAYGKRWATGDLLDADNRPDHVKAAEQVPIEKLDTGNKTVDAVGDTLGEIAPSMTRMGQSLFESIFTQLNEAGRAVQAYDLMTAQSVTLADAATSGENVIAGVKLSAIRSANILRTLANRVVDKVLVRAAEADTKHGILNDADRSQLADTRFDHDLAVSLAEIGVKEGAMDLCG